MEADLRFRPRAHLGSRWAYRMVKEAVTIYLRRFHLPPRSWLGPALLRYAAAMALGALLIPSLATCEDARPPIISPDVPLVFTSASGFGGGPHVVFTTPRWTILADFHDEIITDADGPHVRKLFRRPTAGGPMEEIWNGFQPGKGLPSSASPRIWAAYDDGAVLFSLAEELLYVAKPGECHRWTIKVNDETWLPVYGDAEGIMLWPIDTTRPREAYYVPGQRDSFDLERRIKLTGEQGIRWAEPLVKRYGDVLVWLDWPSWDQQPCTHYRLGAFNLQTKAGWSKDVDVPAGNARLEHFDGHTVQVSGKRYDAGTGNPF